MHLRTPLLLGLGALLVLPSPRLHADCAASTRHVGNRGLHTIFLAVSGLPANLHTSFRDGYEAWNRSRCNGGGYDFPLFTERPQDGARRVEVRFQAGFNPHNDRSCGRWQDGVVWLYGTAYGEGGVVSCTRAQEFEDTVTHELGHVLGLADTSCPGWAMSPRVYRAGSYVDRRLRPPECELADRTHLLAGEDAHRAEAVPAAR